MIALLQLLLFFNRARAHQDNIKWATRDSRQGRLRRWSITAKALTSFGLFLQEYFKVQSLEREELLRAFTLSGVEELDAALRRGRGVVLVSSHVGNWEAGATALALSGYRLHVVAGVQFGPSLSRHVKAEKQKAGIKVVSPGPGQYRSLVGALRNNEIAVLAVDGDVFERGVDVPFFSRSLSAPAGPARLAAMTGATVIASHAIRTGPLRFRLEFKTLWDGWTEPERSRRERPQVLTSVDLASRPPESTSATARRGVLAAADGDGFVQDLTVGIMKEEESVIRANLDQWCIFRRLWPNSRGPK